MSSLLEAIEKTFKRQVTGKLADQDSDASDSDGDAEDIDECTLFTYDIC
jgi:hypothetical protein